MLGFFKARTRTAAPAASAAAPAAKPSMKVTPKGKTSRSKVFKRDEEGNEYGRHTIVQDEDDNWYVERRKRGTGEAEYRRLNVAGAATELKYNAKTGKHEPGSEYDSKEQRLASYINRAGGTLRKEGGYSKSSVEGLPHGLRMNVYAGVKNTKEFGDSVYLPPVEHRNKKTVERETREASYRESASKISEYMGEKPKPTGAEAWDYYTGRDSKAKKIYGEYTVRPKALSGAKSSFEDIDALAEAHKVKPKALSGPKPGEGYDSFDDAAAKPHVKPKPAGTESAGSTRKPYDDKATDDFFGKLYSVTRKPSAKPPVIPVAETVTEPVSEPETDTLAEKSAKAAVKKTATKKSAKVSPKPTGRKKAKS